ncbi:hypothetical protein BGX31_010723 [Mortierella sp. GBA43]|nr:hypothetical protein BGX31_010723 [Mortierella sp. GBA43]
MSPTSGSQMQQQQSLQLQQHLANDMMFQQQQQLLHLNGNLQGSSTEQGKSVKSYATKAGNGSGVFHSSAIGSASVSSSSSSAAPTISLTGNNAAHLGLSQTGSSALASSRKGDLSLGASLAETSGTESTPLVQAELNDHDRFGLFGMLGVIRATDQDSSILALGRDLTTLGLSLNSSE